MEAEESSHTTVSLQPGLVDVEVHPVDAFDFQGHVLLEDFGNGTWRLMGGSGRHDPSGSTNRFAVQFGDALSIPTLRHDRSHSVYISSV